MPARKRKAGASPVMTREFIGQIMADAGLNSRTQNFQRAQNMIYEEINQSDAKRETLSIGSTNQSVRMDDEDSWDSGSECDCKHGRCPLMHCDSSECNDDDMSYSKDYGTGNGKEDGKVGAKVDSKVGDRNGPNAPANEVAFFQEKQRECEACLRHKMRLAAERRKRSKNRKKSKSKKRSQSRKRRR